MRRTAFTPTIAPVIARTQPKTPGTRCKPGSGNTVCSPDAVGTNCRSYPSRSLSRCGLETCSSSHPERDDFSSNRHLALTFCLRMISAQMLRVCREGKPLHTFADHALVAHLHGPEHPAIRRRKALLNDVAAVAVVAAIIDEVAVIIVGVAGVVRLGV